MHSPDVEVYASLAPVLTKLELRWYLFEGQAAILHGATRFTEDVDVTVLLGLLPSKELVRALLASGFNLRVDDIDGFVEKTRVIPLIHTRTSIPVDVVLGGPGLEELFTDRALPIQIGDVSVPIVSVEDLIAMKVLAGRPKDLEDVVSLLSIQSAKLELAQVRETLRLVEQAIDQSDLLPQLEACIRRARRTE